MSNVLTSRLDVRAVDGSPVDALARVAILQHLCAESTTGGSYWVQPTHCWSTDRARAELVFGSGKCTGIHTLPEAFPGLRFWHRLSNEGVSYDDLERLWVDPDSHPEESRWCTVAFDEVRLKTGIPRHELALNGRIVQVPGGLSAPLLGLYHVGTSRHDDVGPGCAEFLEGAEAGLCEEAQLSVVSHPSVDRLCQRTPDEIERVELCWRGEVVATGRAGVFSVAPRWDHVVDPWFLADSPGLSPARRPTPGAS